MNVEELFREGLLKKVPPSKERADKSIKIAERYLNSAEKSFDSSIDDMAIVAAYSAVFHAARAILFLDGTAERSHVAIYEYLKEKHKSLGSGLIETFNLYRKLRHSVAYGLDTIVETKDSQEAINFAVEFIKEVKKYIKNKK